PRRPRRPLRRAPRSAQSRRVGTDPVRLQRTRREGVAGLFVAGVVASREPALPLGGGAVRERVGAHMASHLLLDPIVADRRGRVETVGNVAAGHLLDVTGRDGVLRPDAGEAVSLELESYRTARRSLPVAADAAIGAEQVLHVM